ncbi:MAG: hypothetical protein RI885_1466 [Actinomycetota bacterium]
MRLTRCAGGLDLTTLGTSNVALHRIVLAAGAPIEDGQHLGSPAGGTEGVRNHRRERSGLTYREGEGPFSQQKSDGAPQHPEPVSTRVHGCVRNPRRRGCHSHLGHGPSLRTRLVVEHPGGSSSFDVAVGANHRVLLDGKLDQRFEGGPERLSNRRQLAECDRLTPGLQTTDRRRTRAAERCELLESQALLTSTSPDPRSDNALDLSGG